AAARPFAGSAIPGERVWQREIAARLDLARGLPRQALDSWQALERDARRSGSLEDLWLALVGDARAERALGDRGAALSALSDAEGLLDRQALALPRPGRARFVAQRSASAEIRIELLLDAGRTAEALAAARRSRVRALRQIEIEGRIERLTGDARERWQEAVGRFGKARRWCDEAAAKEWQAPTDRLAVERSARASLCSDADADLESAVARLGLAAPAMSGGPAALETFRPPGAGEVVIAFHPLEKGWVAFAADGTGIKAHRFELPPAGAAPTPDEWSARLLAPFAVEIQRAVKIRVLAYGELREVDLHALPFDGAP